MTDDPYKAPRAQYIETTAMPYIVFVVALASVCALAIGLRSTMEDWWPITNLTVMTLLLAFGTYRWSEISLRVWKPYFAFPQVLVCGVTVTCVAAYLLRLFGVKPRLDEIPLYAWAKLVCFSVVLARICMVRCEMWSERREPENIDTTGE